MSAVRSMPQEALHTNSIGSNKQNRLRLDPVHIPTLGLTMLGIRGSAPRTTWRTSSGCALDPGGRPTASGGRFTFADPSASNCLLLPPAHDFFF